MNVYTYFPGNSWDYMAFNLADPTNPQPALDEDGNRIGVSWVHVGRRWADLPNTIRLGSYDVLSLRAARQLNLHTDVFVSVDNLLNERSGFWLGYPSRGTHVRGGVQHRF